jgi:hypothetical protein
LKLFVLDPFHGLKPWKQFHANQVHHLHELTQMHFFTTQSTRITCSLQILCSSCFSSSKSLTQLNYLHQLNQLHIFIFITSINHPIMIPLNVEILASSSFSCFPWSTSLTSISFQSNSRLMRIKSRTFFCCALRAVIASAILLVVLESIPISLDSCFLIQIPVRRFIHRDTPENRCQFPTNPVSNSGLPHLEYSVVDLTAFEERSVLRQNEQGLTQIHWRRIDGVLVVVKSVSLSASVERCRIETEVETRLILRHPVIAPLVGFAFPAQSSGRREFKTVRLHAAGDSLAMVLSAPPASWTPTAKAEAVPGIALGLRFAHGLGLIDGDLCASNVLFDADRRIQIADVSPNRLDTGAVEPFSGEG